MTTSTTSKADARRARASNVALYAPRQKPLPSVHRPIQDLRLRRITAETLEALKLPGAVPSRVIYDALERATRGR